VTLTKTFLNVKFKKVKCRSPKKKIDKSTSNHAVVNNTDTLFFENEIIPLNASKTKIDEFIGIFLMYSRCNLLIFIWHLCSVFFNFRNRWEN